MKNAVLNELFEQMADIMEMLYPAGYNG